MGPAFAAVFALVLAGGCERKAKVAEEQPAAVEGAELSEDGSAPPAPEPPGPPARCRSAGASKTFRVRGRSDDVDAAESGVDQPFAVELGGAASLSTGFAVGALRHDGGRSEALVAVLDPKAERGQVISLGRVHGGAEPPRLVTREARLLVAVVDSDASGPTIRLARLDPGAASSSPAWGAEVQQGRDESSGFSVAASLASESGLLVWDDQDRGSGHSVVRLVSFRIDEWGKATAPRIVTPAKDDAEAPLLAARPGGYWLAWISRAPGPTGDGAPSDTAAEEQPGLLESGPSRLRIMPLDENGKAVGEARFVTSAQSQVVVFDLLSSPEGGAWLSWRDEARAPGAAGGVLSVAGVAPDGSVQEHRVDAGGLDAGFPALLRDDSRAGAAPWLAANGAQGALLLGLVTPSGIQDLRAEDALLAKQALAAGHGRLLLGQPRGVDLLLETAVCSPEAP